MKKRVLIYYPPSQRAIAMNAVVDLLLAMDIDVFVLTQAPHGLLHQDLEKKMAPGRCFAGKGAGSGPRFYLKNALELTRFCRRHKISHVFSHLQPANLVCLLAQNALPRVKFILFRHHFHYYKKFRVSYLQTGRNERWGEQLINRFARTIVVPSTTVRDGMIEYEKADPKKIRLIPYIYNFNEYPAIDAAHVASIRGLYPCSMLLLMCSRFVEPKRHGVVIDVVDKLLREGLDLKLLMLDDGPLREKVIARVAELGHSGRIIHIGYTDRVLDYMAASDLLLHPSLAEASNSSVKEMGLAGRTAVVCHGIGDFDDYLVDGVNGFLADPMKPEEDLERAIRFLYQDKGRVQDMGASLRQTVTQLFSPGSRVGELYQNLLK